MLNCTDLACVLHHHHFYAHLHHLKNHLQDDKDENDIPDEDSINSNYITQFSNSENDAPNDAIYMIYGVIIAMFLVGLIIILVALTINKLRKRDESSATAAGDVTIEAQQTHGHHNRSTISDNQDQQIFTSVITNDGNINNSVELETITFTRTSGSCSTTNGWVFPPKAPSPNIYNCDNHDAMVPPSERNGFKGFKKQFSGRFKRLVSHKKDATPPIPPELKPQLKTIYVY